MLSVSLLALGAAVAVQATQLLDRNLAYRSPFKGYDEVYHLLPLIFSVLMADYISAVFS